MAAIYGSTAALLAAVSARLAGLPDLRRRVKRDVRRCPRSAPRTSAPTCRPRNPYATAKLAAHQLIGQWRAHTGCFAVSGILFNHESERRPARFVSRKITLAVAEIALGRRERLELGDLSAVRDWSYAGDIMHGAWLSLQHERPDDYVFASGVGHTVADLVAAAFAHAGLDPEEYVSVDPGLVRAAETVAPIGDPAAGPRRARLATDRRLRGDDRRGWSMPTWPRCEADRTPAAWRYASIGSGSAARLWISGGPLSAARPPPPRRAGQPAARRAGTPTRSRPSRRRLAARPALPRRRRACAGSGPTRPGP